MCRTNAFTAEFASKELLDLNPGAVRQEPWYTRRKQTSDGRNASPPIADSRVPRPTNPGSETFGPATPAGRCPVCFLSRRLDLDLEEHTSKLDTRCFLGDPCVAVPKPEYRPETYCNTKGIVNSLCIIGYLNIFESCFSKSSSGNSMTQCPTAAKQLVLGVSKITFSSKALSNM